MITTAFGAPALCTRPGAPIYVPPVFAKLRFRKGRFRWDGTQWACLRPIEWVRPVRELAPRRYLGTSFRIGP